MILLWFFEISADLRFWKKSGAKVSRYFRGPRLKQHGHQFIRFCLRNPKSHCSAKCSNWNPQTYSSDFCSVLHCLLIDIHGYQTFIILHLSRNNLSMKTDLVEATWLSVLFSSTTRPQKLLKWKIFQWEFSDLFFRFVACVLFFSSNYGMLVDIKSSLMWKLVLQLK